jgi:hypothetical protein
MTIERILGTVFSGMAVRLMAICMAATLAYQTGTYVQGVFNQTSATIHAALHPNDAD